MSFHHGLGSRVFTVPEKQDNKMLTKLSNIYHTKRHRLLLGLSFKMPVKWSVQCMAWYEGCAQSYQLLLFNGSVISIAPCL